MRARHGLAAIAIASLAACGDEPSAPRPEPSVPMRLCLYGAWAAYRNDGGQWTRSTGDLAGVHEFLATERLELASARVDTLSPFLRIEQATGPQLAAMYGCRDPIPPASGTVAVALRGVDADGFVYLSYGPGQGNYVSGSQTSTEVYARTGVHDLVATRNPPFGVPEHADRIIVRRALAYAAGASTELDFLSAEAFAPVEHVLRWTGPRAHVQLNFFTVRGNDHVFLSKVVGDSDTPDQERSTTIYSMPSSRLAGGDIHRLFVAGDDREVDVYYREPRDLTLAFGAPASQPTFTTVASAPYVRVRLGLASQPEYGGAVSVLLRQDGVPGVKSRTHVSLLVTKEYLGATPRTWTMTVPDLTGVGLPEWMGLEPGPFEWFLNVSSELRLLEPLTKPDGHVVRSAGTSGERR